MQIPVLPQEAGLERWVSPARRITLASPPEVTPIR